MAELLDYSWPEIASFSQNFCIELAKAEQGEKTSLAFFKHQRIPFKLVSEGDVFQIMSVGGSNLEIAQARYSGNQIEIYNQYQTELPKLDTKKTFIGIIRDHIQPDCRLLVLNFAYPIQPEMRQGRLDGRLLLGTKEHKFKGLVGQLVGYEIEQAVIESGLSKNIRVACANDVICLTLAALHNNQAILPRQVVSMVLGTGNNFGLFIDDNVIVNLESGNFKNFSQTSSGKYIDTQSSITGLQWLEKEVSGRYLFQHFNFYAQKSGIDLQLTTAKEVNELAASTLPGAELARQVVSRSAAFVAAALTGIWQFKQHQNMVCVVEGSLFWHGYKYQDSLTKWLTKLGMSSQKINFIKLNQSNLIGAAQLAVFGND